MVGFVCFPWKNERFQKNQKNIFFFEKKNVFIFFFEFFVFWHFLAFFRSGGKKKTKIFVFFSYKKNLRNVFELKFWHEKLINFNEYFFGAFNRLLLRLKIFFTFLRFMSMFWTNLKKKKLKIWKKFPKIFNFWNFICGSAAEISADRPKIPSKIFFCPKFLPKKFWVKSDDYIIKISKKSNPLPQMAIFFLGGVALYLWLIPVRFETIVYSKHFMCPNLKCMVKSTILTLCVNIKCFFFQIFCLIFIQKIFFFISCLDHSSPFKFFTSRKNYTIPTLSSNFCHYKYLHKVKQKNILFFIKCCIKCFEYTMF